MNLTFDVQLQVALRALEEVVAPALGSAEKHVVEQLHLAMATIGFVKTRLPDLRRYTRMELRSYAELAGESVAVAGSAPDLAAAVAEAQRLLASPEADFTEFEAASRRLRDEIAALGSACTDPATRAKLDGLVLAHGAAMIGQARQWAMPFGFELKPEDLPQPAW